MKVNCGSCGTLHAEINPQTKRPFYRCTRCRRRKCDAVKARVHMGLCRDCGGRANGKVRCLKCSRAMKKSRKDRGVCSNCARLRDTSAALCSICSVKILAHRKLDDRGRWKELHDLFKTQAGKCAITGLPIQIGVDASIDRIVPANRGGTNDLTNLRWVHILVNRMKSDMLDSELLSMAELVIKNKSNLHLMSVNCARARMWPTGQSI